MADIDLPSSESEGELETTKKDQEEEPQEFRPHVSGQQTFVALRNNNSQYSARHLVLRR